MFHELFESSIGGDDGVENIIVAGAIKEVDKGHRILRKVMVVDLTSLPTVHVLHTDTDTQGCRQRADMDVVTLPIHRINFLHSCTEKCPSHHETSSLIRTLVPREVGLYRAPPNK